MLPTINLTSNRTFKIRGFEEDKIATLTANPGLRYIGKVDEVHRFCGNFFLTNPAGTLIESFEIAIYIPKGYPNVIPIVQLLDNKIEKCDDNHICEKGILCIEHTYVLNELASRGLWLYDFIDHFLPKYFSWVLTKKDGDAALLQEWKHKEEGTMQVYEAALGTTDKNVIKRFLSAYCAAAKIERNDKCYCGSGIKLKHCHYTAALFFKKTNKKDILNDIQLFQ